MPTLENDRLVVLVDDATGSLQVVDKVAETTWRQSTLPAALREPGGRLIDAETGAIDLNQTTEGLRVQVEFGGSAAPVSVQWDVNLEENSVVLHLGEVRGLKPGQALELSFPQRLVSGNSSEQGYLVVPIRAGQLVEFDALRRPDVAEPLVYGDLKMALFGAVKGRGAVAGILRTPYDCRLRMEANVEQCYAVSPVWIVEEGRLNYPRELLLVFLADATYVEIAKAYRQEMMRQGRFVSLRSKAEESPVVNQLAGGVTGERRTYSIHPEGEPGRPGIRTLFEQAQQLGFDRACIWFCDARVQLGFFDGWDLEALKREAEYVRGLSEGFRLSVYTNFINIHANADDYNEGHLLRLRDANIHRRGWVCTRWQIERAKKQLPALFEALGPGNIYVDCEGSVELNECFSSAHPMTREDDAGLRRELLAYVKQLFGSVTTEHLPHDFLCDVVDMGAYPAIYPYQVMDARGKSHGHDAAGRDWYVGRDCPFVTVPIPLFQLVWHDAIFSMNSTGKYTDSAGWLENYPCEPMHLPLYGLLPDDLSQRSLMMSRLMRGTYFEEMVEHRFLTQPLIELSDWGLYRTRDVQMSRFADDTVVVANFSDEPFFFDSHTPVPMHEFAIIQPGRPPVVV